MTFSSGPIMSTGNTALKTSRQKERMTSNDGAVMHIALLGDFSGRTNGDVCELDSIGKRKPKEVDRDNFDEVFAAMNVTLNLPFLDGRVSFSEFDDLHPDFLFEKLAVFEKFRTLKRRLKNPSLFQAAADEIRSFAKEDLKSASSLSRESVSVANKESVELTPSVLDDLFAKTLDSTASIHASNDQATLTGNDIDRLIREIVSPYVEQKDDPDLPQLLFAVDEACSATMRKILHASEFQQLESAWRSVYNLVRRLETKNTLKLFLFDMSKEDILADIENSAGDIEQSQLYTLLIESRSVPGGTPFSLMTADYTVEDNDKDLSLVSALSTLAWINNGTALLGADPKLAGCEAIEQSVDPDDWGYALDQTFADEWHSLRLTPESEHIALVAPRTLLRLPYGAKTSPIESFDFEELAHPGDHDSHCWGNSAYSVTYLLAESFSCCQWGFRPGYIHEIENLPLHVYRDEDDESQIKPCGEALLTDSGARKLSDSGLLSVRSVRGKDSIMVNNFASLARTGSLKGRWNG